MKRFFGVFVLTPGEQRVFILGVLLLMLVVFVVHKRRAEHEKSGHEISAAATPTLTSPSVPPAAEDPDDVGPEE